MKNESLIKTSLGLFILALFIVAIILAKNLLIPVVFALFLSYLLYPIVWRIEKRGVHRAISILIVVVTAVIIIGGAVLLVTVLISNATIDFTELKNQVEERGQTLQNFIENTVGLPGNLVDTYYSKITGSVFSALESNAGMVFTATTNTLFQIFVLPIYTFFMLFYRTKMAHFILKLVDRKDKKKTVLVLREVSAVTAKYIGGILTVVLILAVLNTSGLYIIGLKYAFVFGILSALLNLIPYFGTLLGGLIPILYVLISSPSPFHTIFQIVILFVIVQFLENNILTPNIVGNNIKMNPFVIILGLLFANLIWGIAGMLVVVPFLAILKIIMRHVDGLKPFAFLISDKGVEKHRVDFLWKAKVAQQKIKVLWKKLKS